MDNSLPITKQQLIESINPFINKYKRLPYLSEDDIEVEIKNNDGELEIRPYRASKYIKEFFTNQDKLTEYLLQEKIITYKLISEIINIDAKQLEKLIKLEVENPDVHERRSIEIFFNKDYYEHLGKYNDHYCMNCTKNKSCGQAYYASIISCPKYKKKEIKKKNKNT